MRRLGFIAVWLTFAPALVSVAQTQNPPPPVAGEADPAFGATKAAFDALPEAARRAIQDALIWTGDYKGVVDGGFGRATAAALSAYARRANLTADGALATKPVADLIASAVAARNAVGFGLLRDARTGASLGLPLKILTKRTDGKSGSRWTSADGAIGAETAMSKESDGDLPSLFDKLKDTTPARRVTYRILRPDFLVVSGVAAGKAFYTRMTRGAADGGPEIRSFTLTYPAGAKAMENMSIAIANAFDAFPGAPPPAATAAAPSAGAPVASAPAAPSRRPVLAATAVDLGGGHAVSAVGDCDTPQIGGRAAKLARRDEKSGLALFDVVGLPGPRLAATAGAPDERQEALALYHAATIGSSSQVVLAPGEILMSHGAARALAPLEETAIGAPVFDRGGALLGFVGPRNAPVRVAGVVPQTAWPLIPASALATLGAALSAPGAAPPQHPAAADIAAVVGPAVLPVVCMR